MLRFDGVYFNPEYNWRYASVLRFLPDGFCLCTCVEPTADLHRLRLDPNRGSGVGRWRVEGNRLEIVKRYRNHDGTLRPGRVVHEGSLLEDGGLQTNSRDWLGHWTEPQKYEERYAFVPREFPEQAFDFVSILGPSGEWRLNPVDTAEVVRVSESCWLYRTPVTVSQFRLVPRQYLNDPPRGGWKHDWPVVRISRDDALAYAVAVGGRLPTPEEWTLAGGRSGKRKAALVGMGDVNANGVQDLAGNVAEWCSVDGMVLGGKRPVPGPGVGFRVAFDG